MDYKVTLAFGARPGAPYTYTFNSEIAFHAFLQGINTAVGYVEVWATEPTDWKYLDRYGEIRFIESSELDNAEDEDEDDDELTL